MSKEDSSSEGKSEHASSPDSPVNVSEKNPNADIYEDRGPKKIVRVFTVMAYLLSVSFVGILLSAYYIFLWESPNPRFIQRERLRADPQVQLAPSLEKANLMRKDSGLLLQSEVSSVHEPLLGRMTHDMYNDSVVDPRDKINLEKKRRLDATLLRLRHALVRAQKRNSSEETTSSSGFNNSFAEKVLNSTVDCAEGTENSYGESRRNISEKKTHYDNADLPVESTDSVSTLDVESTSSTSKLTTILRIEKGQRHFDRDSVTDVNPIISEEKRYHKKNLDAVESYLARGFSNATTSSDVTSGSDRRVFRDDNSAKVTREFLKVNRKEPMRQNEIDDRRSNNNDRQNDSDVQTGVILEGHVYGSIRNSRGNYSNDESSPNGWIEQIARDKVKVSIDPSSHDSGFIDDPGFRPTPDDPAVVKRDHVSREREIPKNVWPFSFCGSCSFSWLYETYIKESKCTLFAKEKIEGLRCDILLKQRRATSYRTSNATKLRRSILETKLLGSPDSLYSTLITFNPISRLRYLIDKIFHSSLL